jgi:hypothetical protein
VDAAAGAHYLAQVHPARSVSFWYASIAGLFLFLAGLISGFGDNRAVVSQLGARIVAHPLLRNVKNQARLHRIASYLEQNAGPILGNTILGFMLGMAAFVGKITGLPFDIRHITFSTGNIALGFYGVGFQNSLASGCSCVAGIAIIGLFNFAVSFFLALQVAVRSRGIRLRDYYDLTRAVGKYFLHHPTAFFWPSAKPPITFIS